MRTKRTMSDLIDRQAVIDELREYKTEPNISDDESEIKGYNDGIDLAISVLSTLPSAEPSHNGLIGWVCPVCGRGLSPYTTVCPCQNQKGWEITCG